MKDNLLASTFVILTLTSCGNQAVQEDTGAAAVPANIWSEQPLQGAVDVRTLRESGSDGSEVVVRGTLQEFGELSTFRLVEDSLEDCSEMGEEEHCVTPWDYCCTAPDTLAEMTVNVEFLQDGFPGEWSLKGAHGLDHLSEVTVAGTLRIDEEGNLRLEAKRLAMQ